LLSLLAEWTKSTSLATRLTNLQKGGGANTFQGTPVLLNEFTVMDDGSVDRMWGEDGILAGSTASDWFWSGVGDLLEDMFSGTDKRNMG
jgi:hypothetical protein